MIQLPPKPNLRPAEVAEFLDMGKSKVYDLIKAGVIPAKIIGREYRIPHDKFLRWFESQEISPE